MDTLQHFLSESETDISSCFVGEGITGITSEDIWDPILTQVLLTPWKDHSKANIMSPQEGFHDTVWETPNCCELEANISDSKTCWKFADLEDEYLRESSVQGSELSMTSSDTSHCSEIEEVNQQNALTRTEICTQENLWMSVDNQRLNIMPHSSIEGDDSWAVDSTYEGDGSLRKRPIMSKLQFKSNPLKPKATEIMKQKRVNLHSYHERNVQESVEFLLRNNTTPISDGYIWLKYGQKNIKNSMHPRSYFKCASVDCPIKKQVEESSEIEGCVSITYFGKHNHLPPSLHALRRR
ncbi:hypothetical protein KP509_24G019300 [Ceratopteris richardii]|uniref:WRKY domain-containing protein n=1 Tax=Ceratopteris richardii TaxID=49495 RepID=A0A8T2RSZ2_CERRI|nr:hypothetical protein KP509_24G019300 [Ceratopteris richardii]